MKATTKPGRVKYTIVREAPDYMIQDAYFNPSPECFGCGRPIKSYGPIAPGAGTKGRHWILCDRSGSHQADTHTIKSCLLSAIEKTGN